MKFPHRVEPDQKVNLSKIETDGKDLCDDREQKEREFLAEREKLADIQHSLYAEGKQKLLVVFQASDAGGKDGTIRAVLEGVNPQGVRVTSFKKPTPEELAHDYLWRVHKAVPAAGMIGVFNRSHYEDVIVTRVFNLVSEEVWKSRYNQINEFEELLTESGTTILKFFLHISKKEQKQRFQERLDDPTKRWKFSSDDLEKRKHWDDYEKAYEDMMEKCSKKNAPWFIIPADQNWYRNWAITKIIVETLEEMNPQFPEPEEGLDSIVIED